MMLFTGSSLDRRNPLCVQGRRSPPTTFAHWAQLSFLMRHLEVTSLQSRRGVERCPAHAPHGVGMVVPGSSRPPKVPRRPTLTAEAAPLDRLGYGSRTTTANQPRRTMGRRPDGDIRIRAFERSTAPLIDWDSYATRLARGALRPREHTRSHQLAARIEACPRARPHPPPFVVVVISDDGIGGAKPGAGSGLVGLTDRVEALGGRLRLESTPGRGTRFSAEIPCD